MSIAYRPNIFDKAGMEGTRLLQDVLMKRKSQTEVADILGCTPGNVSKIVNDIRDAQNKDITHSGMSMTRYAQQLELENITNKIKQTKSGDWEINSLSVLHHNIIRVDKMIMGALTEPQLAVAMMIQQSKMAEILTKLQPPTEDTLDINQLYSHADAVIKFIPLLAAELDDLHEGTEINFDLKKRFVEYIKDVKGKDYVFEET